MKYFKKLVGERIYLSPRSTEDVEKYTEWFNDFETTDYTGRSHQTMSIELEKKYLEEHKNEDTVFAIVEEAIRLILDFGFNYLNLNNIKLDLMEFNERALACYKKCGFKEYGRRRKCEFINGKYYDTIAMDILAEEFHGDFIKNKNQS